MFGYVRIYRPDLSETEYRRYRSIYCGLCKALGRELGQIARLSLTYDLTFLCLLLFSLTDESAMAREERCVAHPFKKHLTDQNHVIYREAASLSGALLYLKATDNIYDADYPRASRVCRRVLEGHYRHFCREDEGLQRKIEQQQNILLSLEKTQPVPSLFLMAKSNGALFLLLWEQLLANLYAAGWHWSDIYRGFTREVEDRLKLFFETLLNWIYFMDACDDWQVDCQKKKANPFLFCQTKEELWQAALPILYDLEHRLDCLAGQLTFVRDGGIVANVLRAGLPLRRQEIWQKMMVAKNGRNDGQKNE